MSDFSPFTAPVVEAETEYSLLRRAAFASMDAESILTAEFDEQGQIVDFRFVVTNVSASQVLRMPLVALLGHTISEVFPKTGPQLIAVWAECLASGVGMLEEIEIDTDTDQPRWIRQQILPLGDAIAVTSHDITDRRRAEADLHSLAHQDPLTELPNRRAALEWLRASLERHDRTSPTTVLFVDLDRFKAINDTFGHAGGDDLLRKIAARLASLLRAEDMVARFGGDEFVICLDGSTSPLGVRSIIDKLVDALRVPFRIGESDVSISASIGVASSHANSSETIDIANLLVHQADSAAYEAKRQGRDQVAVFDEEIGQRVEREVMVVRELRRAITQGELQVYYQPQVLLANLRPVGMEALVKWNHPEHGLLAAEEFLSIAEDAGLMVPLGRWMRQNGMAATNRILATISEGLKEEFVVWFKVTAGELHDGFLGLLSADSAAAGLKPGSVGIEIEADSSKGVFDTKLKVLRDLREQGFRLALTEVDASHNSIRSLNLLPADAIKMESATVGQIDDPDPITRTALLGIVSVMGQLSDTLGLKLVAGGIERESQLIALQKTGFVAGSGHLVSPAVAEDRLVEILESMYAAAI